jgi:hypothetical protein
MESSKRSHTDPIRLVRMVKKMACYYGAAPEPLPPHTVTFRSPHDALGVVRRTEESYEEPPL